MGVDAPTDPCNDVYAAEAAAADRRREVLLRRVAAGMGLALRKSRTRDRGRMDFGRYRIVHSASGHVVTGNYPYPYSLTLDGAQNALEQILEDAAECTSMGGKRPAHGRAGAADPDWGRQ